MAATVLKVTCPFCPVEIDVETILIVDTLPDADGSRWRGTVDFDRALVQAHLVANHVTPVQEGAPAKTAATGAKPASAK